MFDPFTSGVSHDQTNMNEAIPIQSTVDILTHLHLTSMHDLTQMKTWLLQSSIFKANKVTPIVFDNLDQSISLVDEL